MIRKLNFEIILLSKGTRDKESKKRAMKQTQLSCTSHEKTTTTQKQTIRTKEKYDPYPLSSHPNQTWMNHAPNLPIPSSFAVKHSDHDILGTNEAINVCGSVRNDKYSTYTCDLVRTLESAPHALCKTSTTTIDSIGPNNQPRRNKWILEKGQTP